MVGQIANAHDRHDVHDSFGTNWHMMEMQAVIGRIQLTRMAQWTRTRTQYANMLTEALLPFSSINGALHLPNSYLILSLAQTVYTLITSIMFI